MKIQLIIIQFSFHIETFIWSLNQYKKKKKICILEINYLLTDILLINFFQ